MSREELINIIFDNTDIATCPEYNCCGKPEEEGNTGECCLKCADKQLKEYEDKLIDDFTDFILMGFNKGLQLELTKLSADDPADRMAIFRLMGIYNQFSNSVKVSCEIFKEAVRCDKT